MRFVIGLQPDPTAATKPLSLRAAAADEPMRHPFVASVDLKTAIAVVTFLAMIIGQHVSASSQIAELQGSRDIMRQAIVDNRKDLQEFKTQVGQTTVSRSSYDHDTAQLYFVLGNLQAGQQQIFTALTPRKDFR